MFKFLQGWRRKIGYAALVMAAIFIAAWVRSSYTGDYISLGISTVKVSMLSQQGKISCAVFTSANKKTSDEVKTGWWTSKLSTAQVKFVHYEPAVPYWAIIITLSMIAAWLLLLKPQNTLMELPAASSKPPRWQRPAVRKTKRPRRPKRSR